MLVSSILSHVVLCTAVKLRYKCRHIGTIHLHIILHTWHITAIYNSTENLDPTWLRLSMCPCRLSQRLRREFIMGGTSNTEDLRRCEVPVKQWMRVLTRNKIDNLPGRVQARSFAFVYNIPIRSEKVIRHRCEGVHDCLRSRCCRRRANSCWTTARKGPHSPHRVRKHVCSLCFISVSKTFVEITRNPVDQRLNFIPTGEGLSLVSKARKEIITRNYKCLGLAPQIPRTPQRIRNFWVSYPTTFARALLERLAKGGQHPPLE